MHWETFYFICFLVGLFLSAFSLLGCMGHFGGHFHVPHMPHGAHLPHGTVHGGAHAVGHPAAGHQGVGQPTHSVPWWNTFSIMIFLCWFGAAGFLLTRHGGFVAGIVLVLALICGVAGGAIVFYFLAKVMLPHEHELTADETDVVGVVGRVTSTIRADGIGEMVYEQLGARHSAPVRSEDGEAIQREEEVFVVRYENGIAYVRRWEEEEQGLGIRE
ncbi:MAG: hypothetical protein ABSC76_15240 [Terracidiphilus sp.]|jgi:membrane protein implicated in regulation of membrane protease activity